MKSFDKICIMQIWDTNKRGFDGAFEGKIQLLEKFDF